MKKEKMNVFRDLEGRWWIKRSRKAENAEQTALDIRL